MRLIHLFHIVILLSFSNTYSQDLDNDLEDRVRALESTVASLDTQIQARTTTGAGSLGQSVAGLAVERRIDELARQVEGLTRQVTTLQRQLEQASRDAAAAAREAAAARRDARDALLRAR